MTERVNTYNERRKERFMAAKVDERDIPIAVMSFLGEGEANCSLCDHEIKYCFKLAFPRAVEPVEFEPVGSNCITNWIAAMPDSPEKEAAYTKLATAEKLKDELVARKRAEIEAKEREARRTAEAMRRLSPEDKHLLDRYLTLPFERRVGDIKDISEKLLRYGNFASDKQRGFFAARLREAGAEGVNTRRPTPPPQPRPSTPPSASPRPTTDSGGNFPSFAVPECPKCKGETRRRTSAHGPFFGCLRYPECKGIINVFVPKGQQPLPFPAPTHGSPASAPVTSAPPPSPEALARARAERAANLPKPSSTFGTPVVSAADVAHETGQEQEFYGDPEEDRGDSGFRGTGSGAPF